MRASDRAVGVFLGLFGLLACVAAPRTVAAQGDGSAVRIESVRFLRNGEADPIGQGERITVTLLFSEFVTVSGRPRLALKFGGVTRLALYNGVVTRLTVTETGAVRSQIWFQYDVQLSDVAADGVALAPDALRLHGGSIRDPEGRDVNTDLGPAASTRSGFGVDGGVDNPPAVDLISVIRPGGFASRDIYELGEPIRVTVYFTELVAVAGNPSLELTIGTQVRQAGYHSGFALRDGRSRLYFVHHVEASDLVSAPGLALTIGDRMRPMTCDGIYPNGVSLRFRYTVQASDRDDDGIEIGPNALTLNGGAIRDPQGRDANLSLADTWHPAWVHRKVK